MRVLSGQNLIWFDTREHSKVVKIRVEWEDFWNANLLGKCDRIINFFFFSSRILLRKTMTPVPRRWFSSSTPSITSTPGRGVSSGYATPRTDHQLVRILLHNILSGHFKKFEDWMQKLLLKSCRKNFYTSY